MFVAVSRSLLVLYIMFCIVDALSQSNPDLFPTGEDGLKVMKILEGIYKSAQSGREVRYARGG